MTTNDMIEVEFPSFRYDLIMPMVQGRVPIEGVKLVPARGRRDAASWAKGEFGISDFNWSTLLPAIEAGWEIVALPVFTKRKPVYQYWFCRADAGISVPKDLEGKRIGARNYRTAIMIWGRGLLQDHYGVDLTKLQWETSIEDEFPIYDRGVKIEKAPDTNKGIIDRLLDGDVDAFITDVSDRGMFKILENDPRVKRLFPRYWEDDLMLYRETGIYTPVHMALMSKKLDREHPELAGKLFAGFEQAKEMAYDEILSDRAGFAVVYLRERMVEAMEQWGDPFKYGISANRSTIDAYFRYNYEQGMCQSQHTYEEVFAKSTLDT